MNNQPVSKSVEPVKRAASTTRADSTATSWKDPEVRQRRRDAMRERRRLIKEGKARCFVCGRGPEQEDEESSIITPASPEEASS